MMDHDLLLGIQELLDGTEWDSSTLSTIAKLMTRCGYRIRDLDDKDVPEKHLYTVEITRSKISYIQARVEVEASVYHEAAKFAAQMDLDWIELDGVDEGPTNYEVSSEHAHTECWRED